MGGATISQPWRTLPENNQGTLEFVESYKPQNKEANHLRILLVGPTGAGKSSFINSVDTILQGRITGRALTDATSDTSFTMKYKTYKLSKGKDGHYSFVFNDIMGLEAKAGGVRVEEVKLALKGHVKEGYQFKPDKQLIEGKLGYNSSPNLNDRVHVLVTVVPAGKVHFLSNETLSKMRDIRLAASEMDIPQLAILTKVDEACSEVKMNMNNIYTSKYLKEQVDKFHQLLGVPVNCIFLVKNYESETEQENVIDAHILCALKQIIDFGEDYLSHLND